MSEARVKRSLVLIVEDDEGSAYLLSHILLHEGYQVHVAENGLCALQAVQDDPPDLILLDVNMPGMDGLQVCQRLKQQESSRHIPVLFLSVLSEVHDKLRGFAVGGSDYIAKPFQPGEIIARVATHLRLRELQAQVEAANLELQRQNVELQQRNAELQQALDAIKTLSGLIPICAWCGRKIEDETGQWVAVEVYIQARSEASFTHGMCPECFSRVSSEAAVSVRTRHASPGPAT